MAVENWNERLGNKSCEAIFLLWSERQDHVGVKGMIFTSDDSKMAKALVHALDDLSFTVKVFDDGVV